MRGRPLAYADARSVGNAAGLRLDPAGGVGGSRVCRAPFHPSPHRRVMTIRARRLSMAAVAAGALAVGCGGEGTGPGGPGELAFSPSRLDVGVERRGTVALENPGAAPVGPVTLLPGEVTAAAGGSVDGVRLRVSPTRVEEVPPGSSVELRVEVVVDAPLPPAEYRADVRARSAGGAERTLAVAFRVEAAGEPASLVIEGAPTRARRGEVVALEAVVRDAEGTPVPGADVVWFLLPADAGLVTDAGRLVAYRTGDVRAVAALGELADTVVVGVEPRGLSGSFVVEAVSGPPGGRLTSDLRVRGDHAYTGTWGGGGSAAPPGDALFAWRIDDPANPVLVDSVIVDASTVNDVKVSADGTLGVVTHEGSSDRRNGITLLDLSDPAHPRPIRRYTEGLESGVHNVWIDGDFVYAAPDGREEGLHVIDVSNPASPWTVATWSDAGSVLHDVHVREGLAFLSHWNAGLVILDVGNGIAGGSPSAPTEVSRIATRGGQTHNAWYWPGAGYVFVGEEDFRTPGVVHVVDVRDPTRPEEVATFAVGGAPPHNFWLDEERGILYIGWYGNGARAVDVSGELLGELERQGREWASSVYAGVGPGCPGGSGTCSWAPRLHRGLVFVSDINRGLVVLRPDF